MQAMEKGPKWECIYCGSVMDRTNFTHFIKESDNYKNSIQKATVHYHTWRAVAEDDATIDAGLLPEL
jgi:hypothetical protein